MYKFNKIINSYNLAWIIAFIIIICSFYIRIDIFKKWDVLGWDILSYYIHLPYTFIYHDIGMHNHSIIEGLNQKYHFSGTLYQIHPLPNGNWVSMYTIGFTILYLPFFIIGHVWAVIGGYPQDGFSFPYQFSIANGVLIYIFYGIFILRKILLNFFSDKITMLVMIFLLIGTNYFFNAFGYGVGPHAMMFTAIALVVYYTIQWHKYFKQKYLIIIGFILGVIAISRGTDIICVLIPIFWNVYDRKTLNEKWKLITKYKKQILWAFLFFMIFPIIQIIHWKITTDSYFFFNYQNTQGFDFLRPSIGRVLFNYKNSLLLYTPMIIFPIIGILTLKKKNINIFYPILIFFLLNFYILSSWIGWWEGECFGLRYFVESFVIMAIPFGYFIEIIISRKILTKIIIISIMSFFLFLNVFQSWQVYHSIIGGGLMTKTYYWRAFLKTKVSDEDRKFLEIDRNGFTGFDVFTNPNDYNKKLICYCDYDSLNSIVIDDYLLDSTISYSKPHSCKLSKECFYSPAYRINYNKITDKEHLWFRISFYYYPTLPLDSFPVNFVATFDHKNHSYKYGGYDLGAYNYKINQWNKFSVDYLSPALFFDDDEFLAYIWNRGQNVIYIDNFKIDAYERKW